MFNIKSKLLLTLSLTGSASTFGAFTDNLYVGGNLAINNLVNKKDVTVSLSGVDPTTSPFITDSQKFDFSSGDNKFQFGFVGGYTFEFSSFNLSIEGNLNYNFGSDTQKITNWIAFNNIGNIETYSPEVDEKLKFGFGLFLVPEIELSKKINVFGKIGYNGVQFNSDSNNGSLESAGPLGASGDFNKWANGVALGLGGNYAISDTLTARFEYLYTFFVKFSKTSDELISQTVANDYLAVSPEGKANANYNLSTGTASLSLIYNFCQKKYYK